MFIGATFSSFEELQKGIAKYQNENFVQLKIKNSKRMNSYKESEATKKYCTKLKMARKELVYCHLEYHCVHGGKFKPTGKGERKSRSLKQDCPFFIKLKVSRNGKTLEVTAIEEVHNHEVSKEIFQLMPRQRALSKNEKAIVKSMLEMKCSKKFVKEYIHRNMGKHVILKDLKNLMRKNINQSSQSMKEEQQPPDEFHQSIHLLQSLGTVDMLANENVRIGLFFQTDQMKNAFKCYTELVLIDATYCVDTLQMSVYVMMVVNGNGEGEIVAIFLLKVETTENIANMINIFKKRNPDHIKIKTIFTGKNFKERNILKSEIPSATNFFEKNWDPIRNEWVKGSTQRKVWDPTRTEWVKGPAQKSKVISITNHLGSFTQRIKQLATKSSSLLHFFHEFNTLLRSKYEEARKRAIDMIVKRSFIFKEGTLEEKYFSYITNFAWNLISEEIQQFQTMVCCEVECTSSWCVCTFHANTNLPCRHIFFQRALESLELFSKDLIPEQYSREFHYKHFVEDSISPYKVESIGIYDDLNILLNTSSTTNDNSTAATGVLQSDDDDDPGDVEMSNVITHDINSSYQQKELSKQEKFKKAMAVCKSICDTISNYESNTFFDALGQLNGFAELIKKSSTFSISAPNASMIVEELQETEIVYPSNLIEVDVINEPDVEKEISSNAISNTNSISNILHNYSQYSIDNGHDYFIKNFP